MQKEHCSTHTKSHITQCPTKLTAFKVSDIAKSTTAVIHIPKMTEHTKKEGRATPLSPHSNSFYEALHPIDSV